MQTKKAEIYELILVLAIAFLPSIYSSFYLIISGDVIHSTFSANTYIPTLINVVLTIALMFYVLNKNGENSDAIGLKLTFKYMDLWHAIAIYVVSFSVLLVVSIVLKYAAPTFLQNAGHPKNLDFFHQKNYIGLIILIAILVPVKEELIVRGFTMTRIFNLSGNKWLAVILSVLIQFSYHLYQGLPSALLLLVPFTVFALYFKKFRNLNAVVYAHIIMDLVSTTIFYFRK